MRARSMRIADAGKEGGLRCRGEGRRDKRRETEGSGGSRENGESEEGEGG